MLTRNLETHALVGGNCAYVVGKDLQAYFVEAEIVESLIHDQARRLGAVAMAPGVLLTDNDPEEGRGRVTGAGAVCNGVSPQQALALSGMNCEACATG